MKRQQGLTLISLVVIIIFVLSQVVMAMKIVPEYISDASVSTVLERMEADPDVRGLSNKSLRDMVYKRLKINSVYNVKQENIKVAKRKGKQKIVIDYEPRGVLIGNLDYIIRFHHEAAIPAR